MAGVALMLRATGATVQGSDVAFYPPMGPLLAERGIRTLPGYYAENITKELDVVVVGNVCRKDNPEVLQAQRLGLKLLSMPQVIEQYFLQDRVPLVVTGTHGKTTTTALTSWMLQEAGLDPSFLVGGIALNFHSNYRLGAGRFFVIEGDEYDTAFFDKRAKFFHYKPQHAAITSLEYDHADIYPNLKSIEDAFADFVRLIPATGTLTVCTDWPVLSRISDGTAARVIRYGWDGKSQLQARNLEASPEGTTFDMTADGGKSWHPCLLSLWGRHNVLNALAAASLALQAGASIEAIVRAMRTFQGVRRRLQVRSQVAGVTIVDDFAHHPTAVKETLWACCHRFPGRRVFVVYHFESNTSRRSIFEEEYAEAFRGAEEVYLTYPLVKTDTLTPDQYLDPEKVLEGIRGYTRFAGAWREFSDLAKAMAPRLRQGDVVLAMSGRDLTPFYETLIPLLERWA